VGEDTAGLVGGTLLNLVALAVSEQVALDPSQRRPITLLVDEFHTIPGADYESILAELSKYGANLVLATQSLARLAALDRERERGLQASVFANLDGLFAFNCSAEDARYLVPELGGALDEQDLVEVGEHQCYARLSSAGRRLPTFSVRLDPPLEGDPLARARLIAASAERYGRDAALVEADLRSAAARVELARKPVPMAMASPGQARAGQPSAAQRSPDRPTTGQAAPGCTQAGQTEPGQTGIEQVRTGQSAGRARNQHRKRKRAQRVAEAADAEGADTIAAPGEHESLEEVA
jgi:hypothetical protein